MIFWPPSNNRWQSFVCILYLFDKISHYIEIISMISWIAIMLLFWHYQKLSQLNPGVKISYDILTPPLDIFTSQWIADKVLFAFHIYLIRSLYWNYINDFLNCYNAFISTLPKAIPTQPRGQNIVQYFDPPPPPTKYFHPAQIIDDKVLFAFHNIIYLIRSIIILKLY